MKNSSYVAMAAVFSVLMGGCRQEVVVHESSFTAINPLSYTDVVYKANRDTVFVSTFSGSIAEKVRGGNSVKELINLEDEIFSMAYDPKSHRLYASTLHSGIAVIDAVKMTVLEFLPVQGSWISTLFLSKKGDLLAGQAADRQNYIWDLKSDSPLSLPEGLSNYRVAGIHESGELILRGGGKYVFWNPQNNEVAREFTLSGSLSDIDDSGNILLLYGNDFLFYSAGADSVSFRKSHPDWPYYLKDQDTLVRIPLQLALTVGQLTDAYIFTAGVDRSIRKWSITDGKLLEDIIAHKATISGLRTSPDHSQLVSVDLKGGIHFYELNKKEFSSE